MREVSDRLCRENDLSVIQESYARGKQYGEWQAEKNTRPTFRGMVRKDIDRAIQESLTEQEFFRNLEAAGYEFKFYSKSGTPLQRPSLKPKGSERFFRFDRLGEDYSLDEICVRILENTHRTDPFPEEERSKVRRYVHEHPPKEKHHGFRGLYYYYCYLLKIVIRYPDSGKKLSSTAREDLRNIERLDQEVNLLSANHIESMEELDSFISEAKEDKADDFIQLRTELRNRLKREIRKEDSEAVDKTKAEIAKVTKDIADLKKLLSIADRIQRRAQEVRKTTEDLERQVTETPKQRKEKTATGKQQSRA